jgi:hypothetical protein
MLGVTVTGDTDYGVTDLRIIERIVSLHHRYKELDDRPGLESPYPKFQIAHPAQDSGEEFGAIMEGWDEQSGKLSRVDWGPLNDQLQRTLRAMHPNGSLMETVEEAKKKLRARDRLSEVRRGESHYSNAKQY